MYLYLSESVTKHYAFVQNAETKEEEEAKPDSGSPEDDEKVIIRNLGNGTVIPPKGPATKSNIFGLWATHVS